MTSRWLKPLYGVIASTPWVSMLALGTFVVRARLAVGRWPTYNRPDPKTLDFDLHYGFVVLSMVAMVWAPLALLVVHAAFSWNVDDNRHVRSMTRLFLAGVAIAIAFHWFDPFGTSEWFAD